MYLSKVNVRKNVLNILLEEQNSNKFQKQYDERLRQSHDKMAKVINGLKHYYENTVVKSLENSYEDLMNLKYRGCGDWRTDFIKLANDMIHNMICYASDKTGAYLDDFLYKMYISPDNTYNDCKMFILYDKYVYKNVYDSRFTYEAVCDLVNRAYVNLVFVISKYIVFV